MGCPRDCRFLKCPHDCRFLKCPHDCRFQNVLTTAVLVLSKWSSISKCPTGCRFQKVQAAVPFKMSKRYPTWGTSGKFAAVKCPMGSPARPSAGFQVANRRHLVRILLFLPQGRSTGGQRNKRPPKTMSSSTLGGGAP